MSGWLGAASLPAHWERGRLRDWLTITNGYPFDASRFSDIAGTPLIRIRDLLAGSTATRFDGQVPRKAIVQDGDLLVGMDGDYNAVRWRGGTAALNQRLCKIEAGGRLTQRYLEYVLPFALKFINDLTYATTVKHLSARDIGAQPVPLPPLGVQRRIADHLDAETARIDALIAKRQRQIELLEEHSLGQVGAMVLCGDERARPVSRRGFFVSAPRGWQQTILRHLGCSVQTGPFGSQLHSGDYVVNGWPVVNPQNLLGGAITPDLSMTVNHAKRDELSRHILQADDIVFGRRGEMGRAALVTGGEAGWLCGTGSLRLRIADRRLIPAYLKLLLETAPIRAYFSISSVGSTMENLNSEIVLDAPILLPPPREQRRIVGEVAAERARASAISGPMNRQVALLRERRQALITAAVTGELVID